MSEPAAIYKTGNVGPTILTIEAQYFNFERPEESVYSIMAIAHALSNICRFTGHCTHFYSVAQHSVLVSHLVPQHLALHGLLHDAAEAFMGDVASPLKRMIPAYKEIEKRVERAVFARFGLPPEMPPEIKHADRVALRTEQRDLMRREGGLWTVLDGVEPDDQVITPLLPHPAMVLFVRRFAEITGTAVEKCT